MSFSFFELLILLATTVSSGRVFHRSAASVNFSKQTQIYSCIYFNVVKFVMAACFLLASLTFCLSFSRKQENLASLGFHWVGGANVRCITTPGTNLFR